MVCGQSIFSIFTLHNVIPKKFLFLTPLLLNLFPLTLSWVTDHIGFSVHISVGIVMCIRILCAYNHISSWPPRPKASYIFLLFLWSIISSYLLNTASWNYSLQMHCTENLKQIFPEMKLRGLVLDFYFHVSVSDLYIPLIVLQTQYSKIGGPIVGIYKLLRDTWMQKLGTKPHSFISGNICFEFAVQCVNRL